MVVPLDHSNIIAHMVMDTCFHVKLLYLQLVVNLNI